MIPIIKPVMDEREADAARRVILSVRTTPLTCGSQASVTMRIRKRCLPPLFHLEDTGRMPAPRVTGVTARGRLANRSLQSPAATTTSRDGVTAVSTGR